MPGEENIDSLQIEITSSATDAAKNLNGLVSSLKKLDKIGKSANLVAVKKQLQGIARIQFDNLSVQLAAVTAYIRELQRSGKKISEIVIPAPTIETQNVTAPLGETVEEVQRASEEVREAVENFGQPTEITRPDWLDGMQSECESISDSFEQSVGSLNAARDRLKTALGEKSTFYSDDKTFIAGNNLADTLDDKFERLRLQAEILKEKFNSMVMYSGNKRELHECRRNMATFLADKLGLRLKHNWQIYKMPYLKDKKERPKRSREHRATDFVGFKFFRYKTTIRKTIFLRLLRNIRSLQKGHYTPKNCQAFMSYNGYLKHTDSENVRRNHINGKINLSKIKEIIRNESRKYYTGGKLAAAV